MQDSWQVVTGQNLPFTQSKTTTRRPPILHQSQITPAIKSQDEVCLAVISVVEINITESDMMHKATRQEELDRIDTLTILEVVAYANQVSSRLKCDDCTDEEKKNGLELLGRLTERVQFLKITLEPAFSSAG